MPAKAGSSVVPRPRARSASSGCVGRVLHGARRSPGSWTVPSRASDATPGADHLRRPAASNSPSASASRAVRSRRTGAIGWLGPKSYAVEARAVPHDPGAGRHPLTLASAPVRSRGGRRRSRRSDRSARADGEAEWPQTRRAPRPAARCAAGPAPVARARGGRASTRSAATPPRGWPRGLRARDRAGHRAAVAARWPPRAASARRSSTPCSPPRRQSASPAWSRSTPATYWSGFGQVVILVAIKVGGLGVITLAALLGLAVSRRLGLTRRLLAPSETKAQRLGEVGTLLRSVIGTSLVDRGRAHRSCCSRASSSVRGDLGEAAWHAVFYAISRLQQRRVRLARRRAARAVRSATGGCACRSPSASSIGSWASPCSSRSGGTGARRARWGLHAQLTVTTTLLLLVVSVLGPRLRSSGPTPPRSAARPATTRCSPRCSRR